MTSRPRLRDEGGVMKGRVPWINIILFVLTVFTTLWAGAFYNGVDVLEEPLGIFSGFSFSFSIMLILLCHEFSHYFASKRNNTKATLPYFIPGPPAFASGVFGIGTFGAVIKMKSPILTRKALVEIGASGPIGGFIVSVAVTALGLSYSEMSVVEITEGDFNVFLGPSLLFYAITTLVHGSLPAGMGVDLHPVAFAGWLGLFITSLNLIPVGQLDGGHIAYAFLGPRHRRLSYVLVGMMAVMGVLFWMGWLLWALILVVLGLKHPPVEHWEPRLDPVRRRMGLASLVIFVLTFTPAPFMVTG